MPDPRSPRDPDPSIQAADDLSAQAADDLSAQAADDLSAQAADDLSAQAADDLSAQAAVGPSMHAGLRAWVLQDWDVNATRVESQLILAWFRLAQWAHRRMGRFSRVIVMPYWWTVGVLMGVELPVTTTIGPRLRLYHPHTIVVNPQCTLGSDCHLRHGVTIGNRTNRDGSETPPARLGDGVDLGAGCVLIGDLDVGDHARIGALAVVLKSVPAGAVVVGNPGRVVRIDQPAADAVTGEYRP